GFKMLALHHVHIPVGTSVMVILGVLATGLVGSVVVPVPSPLKSPVESERGSLMRVTLETAVRTVVLAVGGTVILFGAMLLFLPGVGMVVITAGLSVLAT